MDVAVLQSLRHRPYLQLWPLWTRHVTARLAVASLILFLGHTIVYVSCEEAPC